MSDDLSALAAVAGRALVRSMVSDGWSAIRDRMARLFARGDTQRARQAAAQLDAARDGLQRHDLDRESVASRWQGRIETLLESHPELAGELAELVRQLEAQQAGPREASHLTVTADRGSYASGRDMHLDQREDHSRTTRTSNNGGPIAGAIAVVVVTAVLLIGRAVFVTLEGVVDPAARMSESTTCREFLAADSETQADVMKRLYLEHDRPDRAADPFIVQNAYYSCGSRPNRTLGQLAS